MRVLELFSGIGGMHYALKESRIEADIIAAVDINTAANEVYRYNFPRTKLIQRNIQSLSAEDINGMSPDMILMSPPCQPFTRVGLRKDISDNRSCAFLHVLSIIPQLIDLKYVLLENVKGFETSEARNLLLETLKKSSFTYQEFILSPTQIGVPNVRYRYYVIAKRKPLKMCFDVKEEVMVSLPHLSESMWRSHSDSEETNEYITNVRSATNRICDILETDDVDSDVYKEHLLTDKMLLKHSGVLDIVTKDSVKSCCFTKAYTHYAEGTGSVYCPFDDAKVKHMFSLCETLLKDTNEYLAALQSLCLRYFTPTEVSRLMCFPDGNKFLFPANTTTKQKYRLLVLH